MAEGAVVRSTSKKPSQENVDDDNNNKNHGKKVNEPLWDDEHNAGAKVFKSLWVSYTLWLFLGWFGVHHLYLRRDRHAFLCFALLGGGLGVGWLNDAWKIPAYVREANRDAKFVQKLQNLRRKNPSKPPFNLSKFITEVVTGNLFGLIFAAAIPQEKVFGFDLTFFGTCLIPFAIALGVHTVGNMGYQEGTLLWPLVSACIFYPMWQDTSYWPSVLTALTFERKKRWKKRITYNSKKYRLLVLSVCVFLYLGVITSYLYFNAEVTDNNGETIKFRYAIINFFESPAWNDLVFSLGQMYNYIHAHGFYSLWTELIGQMDLQGEKNSLKILGLPDDATQEEITAAYRKLSRQWHPDRHKDPEKKLEAQEQFMAIQQAYERISDLKGRRSQKSRTEF